MNKSLLSMLAIILVLGLFTGCEKPGTSRNNDANSVSIVVLPSGEEITVATETITPKSTEYTGEGIKYSRKFSHYRTASPFGVSPGESAATQKPAQIATGTTPAINITPDGVNATEGGETKFKGASGSWTWWDKIKERLTNWFWLLIIGAIAFFVLPIIFPVLKPIFSIIWSVIKRIFQAIVPIIGSIWAIIEGWFAKKKLEATTATLDKTNTALVQTVQGVDAAKAVNPEIKPIVNTELEKKQDVATKEIVAEIRGQ